MTQRRTRYPGPIAEAKTHPHTLIEQGFAEDAALAAVLDRYPAELFDINLYDYDDEGQVSLRTGARGGCQARSCWRRSNRVGFGSICAGSRPAGPSCGRRR